MRTSRGRRQHGYPSLSSMPLHPKDAGAAGTSADGERARRPYGTQCLTIPQVCWCVGRESDNLVNRKKIYIFCWHHVSLQSIIKMKFTGILAMAAAIYTPAVTGIAIGIDLGTTYSCGTCAWLGKGRCSLLYSRATLSGLFNFTIVLCLCFARIRSHRITTPRCSPSVLLRVCTLTLFQHNACCSSLWLVSPSTSLFPLPFPNFSGGVEE